MMHDELLAMIQEGDMQRFYEDTRRHFAEVTQQFLNLLADEHIPCTDEILDKFFEALRQSWNREMREHFARLEHPAASGAIQ